MVTRPKGLHCTGAFFLENTADKGISVYSSPKGVRRTSHRARRRRGPCRASGSRRDWSGSSRLPLQRTLSGEKEQVRPERAAASVTVHFESLKFHNASPNIGPHQTSQSLETHRNTNFQLPSFDSLCETSQVSLQWHMKASHPSLYQQ